MIGGTFRRAGRLAATVMLGLLFSVVAFAQGGSFTVSVTRGSGDGTYPATGARPVFIWADPPDNGMVFDRWTGDVDALDDPFSARTQLVARGANVSVTATYRPSAEWNSTAETINGVNARYYFPPNPFGVILRFHGTGGGANNTLLDGEKNIFNRDAVARGFAIVALDSFNRVDKQWDNANLTLETNRDAQNVKAALDLFLARGWMTAATPIFTSGISNGGAFAPRAAFILGAQYNIRAVSIFIASGPDPFYQTTTLPHVWAVANADSTIGESGNARARANFETLAGRGIRAKFRQNGASPVYPLRFWQIPGLSAADSVAIQTAFKNAGVLDAENYLTVNPLENDLRPLIPPGYGAFEGDIQGHLKMCFGEHEFFSDADSLVLNLFATTVSPIQVSAETVAVPPGGGTFTLDVTAIPQATWTARANSGWLAVTGGKTGNGNGQVTFTVAAAAAPRIGTLTVAERTVRVIQGTLRGATPGAFRPTNGFVYQRDTSDTGFADREFFYGTANDLPVAGDWDGDGVDSVGIYRDGVFFLRNANSTGFADLQFSFGQAGDLPIAGDWDGDGVDTVGIVRGAQVFLKNSNAEGFADLQFTYGTAGDVILAGDWDGDGVDTVGAFRPSNGFVYLRNTNSTGIADIAFFYGQAGDRPVAGDWNADGIDTIGVVRGNQWLLRNSNSTGFADFGFFYGTETDLPITGDWNGLP